MTELYATKTVQRQHLGSIAVFPPAQLSARRAQLGGQTCCFILIQDDHVPGEVISTRAAGPPVYVQSYSYGSVAGLNAPQSEPAFRVDLRHHARTITISDTRQRFGTSRKPLLTCVILDTTDWLALARSWNSAFAPPKSQ